MRRISVLLALAAVLLTSLVAYTYKLSLEQRRRRAPVTPPAVPESVELLAHQGWSWKKDDPATGHPIVIAAAQSFEGTKSPSAFNLVAITLRLFNKEGSNYTYVRSARGLFDEGSGILKSDGPVTIIMNVPAAKDAEKKDDVAKLVRVETSGVTYETQTGKATTDAAASFHFADGGGKAVGADYDPAKHELHLKSQISLDWTGGGPLSNALHVEAGDLVYKETEQKIYLSPWSKLKRQGTTIQAQNSIVTLVDGVLHQVDSDHAFGTDDREQRHQDYSANTMTALFNDDGVIVNILANGNARIVSTQPGGRTMVTSDRADLRFAAETKQVNGKPKNDSDLHLVLADGHANAVSQPLPQANVLLAETRILRSEHIELEMKGGGKDIQEIRTSSQAQLEFKPNRDGQSHRTLDASHLRILYGANNDIDNCLAWNAATHTDKPQAPGTSKDGKPPQPPAPALTWSDELVAKFTPNTNQIATMLQKGNFRYQEGLRQARAKQAFLEQNINKITLTDSAHIWDDTGSTYSDTIIMNQQNGDIDAAGHVVSTHEPDRNAKPGTSMLDDKQPMQGRGDKMWTRENNQKVHYEGHAIIWQGANRTTANVIDIDRDAQILHAVGSVASELVDSKSDDQSKPAQAQPQNTTAPTFTVVHAPELLYQDGTRVAHYTGGVKLVRDKMTVTSKELRAFLTPKTESSSNDSSLDHAFADGSVTVFEVMSDRTRTGMSDHCEYYPKQDKVVLNGGLATMLDTLRGTTKGKQLTYFSDDDRLIVEGQKKEVAFTQMNRKK